MTRPSLESVQPVISSSVGSVGDQNSTMGNAGTVSITHQSQQDGQCLPPYPIEIEVEVTKQFSISASHILPNHLGKCKNLHGHNYIVSITMRGIINTRKLSPALGMVEDFAYLDRDFEDVINIHDHTHLNTKYINPTAEILASSWLKDLHSTDPRYIKVKVWETDDCSATARILHS